MLTALQKARLDPDGAAQKARLDPDGADGGVTLTAALTTLDSDGVGASGLVAMALFHELMATASIGPTADRMADADFGVLDAP